MAGRSRTVRKDRGKKRIIRELAKFKLEPFVKVGFPKESSKTNATHGDSKFTVLQIALVHEFGAPDANIPQRSFLRSTFNENRKKMPRFIGSLAKRMYRGQITANQMMDLIGIKATTLVKKKIDSNVPPPLQPKTVAKKGSSRTLVDTGQMKNSVTHVKVRFGKGRR